MNPDYIELVYLMGGTIMIYGEVNKEQFECRIDDEKLHEEISLFETQQRIERNKFLQGIVDKAKEGGSYEHSQYQSK